MSEAPPTLEQLLSSTWTISSDSHVIEPPDLWQDRMPVGLRDDYPHTESTFPRSQQVLQGILAGVAVDDAARIVRGNAADLYHFDVPSRG